MLCKCVSARMYRDLEAHFVTDIRKEIIGEIQAFANDYAHRAEGRDVVIVEQLLAFLTPPEGETNGLGTTG